MQKKYIYNDDEVCGVDINVTDENTKNGQLNIERCYHSLQIIL